MNIFGTKHLVYIKVKGYNIVKLVMTTYILKIYTQKTSVSNLHWKKDNLILNIVRSTNQ